jgi:hypothetical protein
MWSEQRKKDARSDQQTQLKVLPIDIEFFHQLSHHFEFHDAGNEEVDDEDDIAEDDAFADEDTDNESLNLLDLTAAVPPAPVPIVPSNDSDGCANHITTIFSLI